MLTFPAKVDGEIARTVHASESQQRGALVNAPEPGNETIVGEAVEGRDYVVEAACLSDRQDTTVSYRVLDPSESSADLPLDQRTSSAGELPCDGTTYTNTASPLTGPVMVQFDSMPADVIGSFAVVRPG
jgi:hypothetical protein